jgi:UDP:flavonoid glycosyltransferase YjiC (YdhE family)
VSRILLTWESGLNLGHLARLLPVAQRLKDEGHTVLVASRDLQAAATVLSPAGISFVQSPHLPKGIPLSHRATGYADILLSQGWSDPSALWGLTQGWLNLIGMFRPDQMILDYSPTVMLAARITKILSLLVGNGFELPPATDPLPAFPGFSWATPEKAAASERVAVANANHVLNALGAAPIAALRDLVLGHTQLLATFPALDHYGERSDAHYIGPLLGKLKAPKVEWPAGDGPKVFACLRPDTSHVQEILAALAQISARVVCVSGGFTLAQLQPHAKKHILFSRSPVDLERLLDADMCVSYGAEGTMLKLLLAGIPQLVSPWHVETFMAVRRIEAAGLGAAFATAPTVGSAADSITRLLSDSPMRARCGAFASDNNVPDASPSVVCAIRDSGNRYVPVRRSDRVFCKFRSA